MAATPPTISPPSSEPKENVAPMAWSAGRKANETPMTIGRLPPMRRNGAKACRPVSSAERMSATWMMSVRCSVVKLNVAAMRIAGVMMPANDARTCWSAQGSISATGGIPSRWNRNADAPLASAACVFAMIVLSTSLRLCFDSIARLC